MSYLWDSNILRHYLETHPQLLENLGKVPHHEILIPIVVAAEQLRGRMDGLLKTLPSQLPRAQQFFQLALEVLREFDLLYFDDQALAIATQLIARSKTKKRYANVLIAAQASAGNHILVTRNTADFRDLLPAQQLQNWIDEKIS
jgi:predicted nucleic acid-binding protein